MPTIQVTGTQLPTHVRGLPRSFYVEAFRARRRPMVFPRSIETDVGRAPIAA